MDDETFYTQARQRMVEEQIAGRDIDDERVLEAMRTIPRHRFILPEHLHLAYADGPLPIGYEQTISQPYIVALMTQLLVLRGREKVLEIGTGSGYQAAILGYLAREVHSVERHGFLAERAAAILADLGIQNVTIHCGDGSNGWPEAAPFDTILVTAAAPRVPKPLFEQLANGGRLVIPVGARGNQYLERYIRRGADYQRDQIAPVAFVPLIGQHGWEEDAWDWI
jgi:protein-L-isoaspartate(D-aspartate) O-methyltransferase